MDLLVVENHLVLILMKGSEQHCPLAVRTFNPACSNNLLLPRGLASSLLLSSHCAVERLLDVLACRGKRASLLNSAAGSFLLHLQELHFLEVIKKYDFCREHYLLIDTMLTNIVG